MKAYCLMMCAAVQSAIKLHAAHVLRPSRFPEKFGVNTKGLKQARYSHQK